jgi:hypothetical protein
MDNIAIQATEFNVIRLMVKIVIQLMDLIVLQLIG